MKFKLLELNENMGKDVYDMYQDIPNGENNQTNECYGLTFDEYKEYLKKEVKRKNNKVTIEDTPTITYVMYVDDYPVGIICLRTKLDENWLKWSGNCYYKIRVNSRNKGYGTKMLSLALDEFKKMNFKDISIQSSKGNTASAKIIENNGGIFQKEENGTRYYIIKIK